MSLIQPETSLSNAGRTQHPQQQQQPERSKAAWEGLGGPVRMDALNAQQAWLDPTLEACCQRDMAERAHYGSLQRTLRRFDVTVERERRRRHVVALSSSSSSSHAGCRCLYDPQVDGGTYAALESLQASLRQDTNTDDDFNSNSKEDLDNNDKEEGSFGAENNKDSSNNNYNRDLEGEGSDDDDEFDYLLDEDLPGQTSEAVQSWEDTRRMEMEALVLKQEVETYHGYGQHCQFHPRRIAAVVGLGATHDNSSTSFPPPPMVVWHLYDSESYASAWLDVYLTDVATRARGTLFVRSHGRGTLLEPSVTALRDVVTAHTDLPALVLVQDGAVVTAVPRLRDFVVDAPNHRLEPHIDKTALENWLFQTGALDPNRMPPAYESLCRLRPEEEALMDSLLCRPIGDPDQEAEESPAYHNCGLPGCQKTFFHEHVGITTEQQDGLVVSADTILGQ